MPRDTLKIKAAKRKRAQIREAKAALRKPKKIEPLTYTEAKKLYNTDTYKTWRTEVLRRDKFQCQMCGQKGKALEVHHIKPKHKFPELTLDHKNGITLCKSCHQERVTSHEECFYFIFQRIVKLNLEER